MKCREECGRSKRSLIERKTTTRWSRTKGSEKKKKPGVIIAFKREELQVIGRIVKRVTSGECTGVEKKAKKEHHGSE